MGILFPGALCIGATFPYGVRVLARDESDAGAASARVLAANTLGSIAGSLGAGFFVIPWLGYVGTMRAAALLNLTLAGAAAIRAPLPRVPSTALAAAALIAIAVLPLPMPWRLLSVGVDVGEDASEVRYFGVGRSATVLLAERDRGWMLFANGLSEAAIDPPDVWHGYLSSDRWIGAMPVLARPELASMMVIGLGGGVSLESIPLSVERVDVVELEPEVIAANRSIGAVRWRDPLSEARVHLHANDARNALLLSDRRFDAIVSQPSYPWTGGTSNLFTREFFELVESRLEDDGVFVQWLGLALVNDPLFRSLVGTLRSVFPFVRVYSPPPQGRTAAVFIASNAPLDLEATAGLAIERNRARLAEIGLNVPEDVAANLILDERGAREVSDGAPWNVDDHNRFQDQSFYDAGKPLVGRLDDLYGELEPFASWRGSEVDALRLLDRLPPSRAARLAGLGAAMHRMPGLARPIDQRVARALVDDSDAALVALREALGEEPRHVFARAVVLRSAAAEVQAGAEPGNWIAPPLDAAERALVDAWRAAGSAPSDATGSEEWKRRDAALAEIPPEHPLFVDAQWVRARWRVASGSPALAREALPIMDRVLRPDPGDLILRANACAAAGKPLAALDSLSIAMRLMGSSPAIAQLTAAREALAAIPPDPAHQALRARIERRLRALDPLRG
jgi:spermidine synthase